jgi:hypothetical protein
MTTPVRAALYLRVSTGRQADTDLSIPDQRRQAKMSAPPTVVCNWCQACRALDFCVDPLRNCVLALWQSDI